MHCSVYDVFYSLYSHQHVAAAISAIFKVMLLSQQYKGINVGICVTVTAQQLKIIITSVKIM